MSLYAGYSLSFHFRVVLTLWSTLRRSTSSTWWPWPAASPSSSSSAWSWVAASAAHYARSTTSRREQRTAERTDIMGRSAGWFNRILYRKWKYFLTELELNPFRTFPFLLPNPVYVATLHQNSKCTKECESPFVHTYLSHISNSNSPRILKMRSHDIFIVPRKREANPRRIPPSQALIKIKEQQDYPPTTRKLRFPCLFPFCTKRTIIHTCFESTTTSIVAVIICVPVPTDRVKMFLRLRQLTTGWTAWSDTALCWCQNDCFVLIINCKSTTCVPDWRMSKRYVVLTPCNC